MTWLVTGGAGFIGGNFIRRALALTKARIVVLDALTYAGNLRSIEDVLRSDRVEFIKGDITNTALVEELFSSRGLTHVAHFAAESHVDRSILGPRAFVETNVIGTFVLLEAVRKSAAKGIRFLHVSTDEVYGSLEPDAPPATEENRYVPSSPYSASKAASDHLAHAWQHTYGLPIVITNCSNNYGPWQFPEKLIPLMIMNALEGRDLPIYGDGLQIRDWIHVEDHAEALIEVLQHGRVGETYNIGGNNERTNRDIVGRICACVDQLKGAQAGTAAKLMKQVTDRPGHDRRYALDSSKIEREIGWRAKRGLEEELPRLVRWYQEHKAWADEIRSGDYRKFYEGQYLKR